MAETYKLPAFVSPLTDKEHAQLGRIAVLWGQIDWLIDQIILNALQITLAQQETLIGEKPIGPKIVMVKKHFENIHPQDAETASRGFIELLDRTKSKRNHIFHGIWGWRAHPRKEIVQRCARHPKSLDNPVKVEDLPKLESDLCEAVTQGVMAVWLIRGQKPEAAVVRFLHGRDRDTPEWFQRWSEQHPLLGDNWDRNWSAGQLPRLVDPMK